MLSDTMRAGGAMTHPVSMLKKGPDKERKKLASHER